MLRDPALTERAGVMRRLVMRQDIGELRSWSGWLDLAWVLLWLLGLGAIVTFQSWETVPFFSIWIAFALLSSFRVRSVRQTVWVLVALCATTSAAIGWDVLAGSQTPLALIKVPMVAGLFWVMTWHGRRTQAADAELIRVGKENERLLATQRQFLQDASHQLKAPITIALGHSELLARNLADHQDQRDIHVIVGELTRLRGLSERLLLIAASANPDFLRPEPVELDQFAADVLLRWRSAADRCWQFGRLDPATALADSERLGLALDALLENAVQHTGPADLIRLSVEGSDDGSGRASLIVQDTGTGIAADALPQVFERFSTGSPPVAGHRGTGLGLSLVRAVAQGHGGEVRATSVPGLGSKFEIILPVSADQLLIRQASETSVPAHEHAIVPEQAAEPASTVATVGRRHVEYGSGQ